MDNKVDPDEYTKILEDHVIDFLHMHEPLQQVNAQAHTSVQTMLCTQYDWIKTN